MRGKHRRLTAARCPHLLLLSLALLLPVVLQLNVPANKSTEESFFIYFNVMEAIGRVGRSWYGLLCLAFPTVVYHRLARL